MGADLHPVAPQRLQYVVDVALRGPDEHPPIREETIPFEVLDPAARNGRRCLDLQFLAQLRDHLVHRLHLTDPVEVVHVALDQDVVVPPDVELGVRLAPVESQPLKL